MTRPARITRPSPKRLVSGGHTATDRNASSVPDGMHIACHNRRAGGPPHPESPDTAAEAAPRGGRVSPTSIPPGRPAAPSPAPQQRATGVVMRACSPTRRINHRLVGPVPRGRGAPKSMLPSPLASDDLSSGRGARRDPVPDGDDSTAFSGVFVRAEPALPYFRDWWRGNDKHPCWQCVHTERASVGRSRSPGA